MGILDFLFGQRASQAAAMDDPLPEVFRRIMAGKALLLDVRERNEWEQEQVANTTLLPLSQLKGARQRSDLPTEIPSEKQLYTFCVKGARAKQAAEILRSWGFQVTPLSVGPSVLTSVQRDVLGK